MHSICRFLLDKISINQKLIDDWFENKFYNNKPLFYNSVDLRHSKFKIAPIDTNCFPAGFNNLSKSSKQYTKIAINKFLQENYPNANKILILPENHTRNIKYLENMYSFYEIISEQDREVVFGSLIENIENSIRLEVTDNKIIVLNELVRNNDKISTKSGFTPDLIITNNDFTNKPDEIINNLLQPIIPSTTMGWYNREKSAYFNIYNQLSKEISNIIDIDHWLISSLHSKCDNINFKDKYGLDVIADQVDVLIKEIQQKYELYDIKHTPYCYLKANKGTYGMAIMTANSGNQILQINKKERNKMSMIKGNVKNVQIIIQEGIPTADTIQDSICEPLIYLINGNVVGNLFRSNNYRDNKISLNSTGMIFGDLSEIKNNNLNIGLEKKEDVIKVYSLIAKLAALATSVEKEVL